MTNPLQITRKAYWMVGDNAHSTEVEAFQDATNAAMAAPGTTITVQPPSYEVVYTAQAAAPPPSDPAPPPDDPTPPPPVDTDGFKYVRGMQQINPVYPSALPAAGGTWTDPTTGATIERVTDYTKLGSADNGGALRTVYSRYTRESCDGKYLVVCGVGSPTSYVIDRVTGALVRELYDAAGKPIGEPNEIRWDYQLPNVIRYVKGMQFWQQNIVTGENTLIRDFSPDFPDGDLLQNDVEGDSSHDSRYWCWQVKKIPKSGSYYAIAFVVYDLVEDKILGTMTFDNWGLPQGATTPEGRMPTPNMVEISPDGRWALIDWNRCWGTGSDPNSSRDANLIGTHADGPHCYPLTLDVTKAVKVGVDATHSAWALSADSKWGLCSQNNRNDFVEWVDPTGPGYHDDGTGVVRLINQSALGWNTGYHFAGAAGAPGWVLMSTYSPTQQDPGDNQLILLPITANCNPLRVSPTYGLHDGKMQDGYWQEAAACWSDDGQRIYWPGDFGGKAKTDVYRINLPADWQTMAGSA